MKHSEKMIRNQKTGQVIRFLRTSHSTAGRLLEMESTYSPRGTLPPAHFHPNQVEDFTVVSGELSVRMEGQIKILGAGDHLHIPPNMVHTMWNASSGDTVVNWQVRPALDTQSLLETAFSLANASKSHSGTPTLLQTALLMRRFSSEFRLAKPGPHVQKLVFGLLVSVARLAGHPDSKNISTMKNFLFLSCLLLVGCLSTVSAQSMRVGYYGETVTHYGFKVAAEWTLKSYVKERNQARKQFLAGPALAMYRHPQNHIGLVFSPELTYRRTGRRGGIFEVGLAPASAYYFLEGITYTPDESGDLRRVRWAGQNAFLPTVFVGIGQDLSVRRQVPLAWFTRLNLMQQFPYNTSSLTRFSLEAGVIFPLKKS